MKRIKNSWTLMLRLLLVFYPFSSILSQSSEAQDIKPFTQQTMPISSELIKEKENAYEPFTNNQETSINNRLLSGSRDDNPISGITPVNDSLIMILSIAFAYGVYLFIRRKKFIQMKKLYPILTLMLFASNFAAHSQLPDNVMDQNEISCYGMPNPNNWSIRRISESPYDKPVSAMFTPLAGDINGDGKVELIVAKGEVAGEGYEQKYPNFAYDEGDYYYTSCFYIFSVDTTAAATITLIDSIVTPVPVSVFKNSVSIANVNGNKYASVFITTGRGLGDWGWEDDLTQHFCCLLKYSYNTLAGKYALEKEAQYSSNYEYYGGIPLVADFDADGNAEVQVYNKIFDARTMDLLVEGVGLIPSTGTEQNAPDGFQYGWGAGSGHIYAKQASRCAVTDIDGDGKLEVIAGDCVYKVNINNRSNPSANTFTLFKRADRTGRTEIKDGYVSIADLDLDGQLDVVVTGNADESGFLYAWNPRTGAILHTNVIHDLARNYGSGPSMAFIGDIDGDKVPEIVITESLAMRAYKLSGNQLVQKWTLSTTDYSGSTVMSLFDFDNSGKAKLVYRDETSLRIVDGSTSSSNVESVTLGKFRCTSGTSDEYPIVVDANKDGSANIVVCGNHSGTGISDLRRLGTVQIYGPGANDKWAPARSVWNQYAYNVVNVNEDLTIPQTQFNPATLFTGGGACTPGRPYNAYLQQQTLLSPDGCPYFPLPNLQWNDDVTGFGKNPHSIYHADGDSLEVFLAVKNIGVAAIGSPVYFTAYQNNNGTYSPLEVYAYNEQIRPKEEAIVKYSIKNFKQSISDFDGNLTNPLMEICFTLNDSAKYLPNHQVYQQVCETAPERCAPISYYLLPANDFAYTTECKSISINVLSNDIYSSCSASELITSISNGKHGTAAKDPVNPGHIIYTPNGYEYGVMDTLSYTIKCSDDFVTTESTATVYVYIFPCMYRVCKGENVQLPIDEFPKNILISVNYKYATGTGYGTPGASLSSGIIPTGSLPAGQTVVKLEAFFTQYPSQQNYQIMSDYNPLEITIEVVPPLMYWRGNKSSNWNDPDNWMDKSGNSIKAVPKKCTTVHIPGNCTYYPWLRGDVSKQTLYYGDAECDSIIFHFGGEVAKSHRLDYEKAFVQYNFGYYDNNYVYKTDGDQYSATPMKRYQWYALAAPLNKIASGDFCVGGYPTMWQQGFKTSPNSTSDLIEGTWHTPENTNAWDIGTQYNAVSIRAGEYAPYYGEDAGYHTNLNALKGILEMPYFENATISNLHRLHTYTGGKSYFQYYYYNFPNLDPVPTSVQPAGVITRGEEAYRFIFDQELKDSGDPNTLSCISTVPANEEIMFGNPFVSSFDFNAWYSLNSSRINSYYRLYENGVWNTYDITTGSPTGLTQYIAPLQAFFIKTKGISGTYTLLSPPDVVSVTRPSGMPFQFKSATASNKNIISLKAENEEGYSGVNIVLNSSENENIYRLFSTDNNNVPQLYAVAKDGSKNDVLFVWGESEVEIPLGILCESKKEITLTINTERLGATESLVLMDKYLNKEINLFNQHSYTFENVPEVSKNRFTLITRVPSGIKDTQTDFRNNLGIYCEDNILHVQSSKPMSKLQIASLQGITIFDEDVNSSKNYEKTINLSPGVYVVNIKINDGQIMSGKIIVK